MAEGGRGGIAWGGRKYEVNRRIMLYKVDIDE